MGTITVVVAHRGKAGRERCLRLLAPERGVRVAGEARSSLEAVATVARLKPRVLLLDLGLAWVDGFALLPVLRRRSPRTKVILLTSRAADSRVLEALSQGALGYLDKGALGTFLPKAVRVVDAGEAWVPRKMVARIVERLARLTVRVRPAVSGRTRVHRTKVQ